jgi:Ubiquitin-conjugating enzyme
MSGIAIGRLTEERKNWRKEHPPGFHARPIKKADNSTDIMTWEIGIPGKSDTDWEGGVYNVLMEFPDEYPSKVKHQGILLSSVFTCYVPIIATSSNLSLLFTVMPAAEVQVRASAIPSKCTCKFNVLPILNDDYYASMILGVDDSLIKMSTTLD